MSCSYEDGPVGGSEAFQAMTVTTPFLVTLGGGVTSTHNKWGCAILTAKVAPKNPGTYLKLRPKNPETYLK